VAPAALNVGIVGLSDPDSEHEVRLTWIDAADNEEGFYVQRKTGASSYITLATLSADTVDHGTRSP
jgi:hypothetical protein